jgi:AcrR family transcriptional regulator
MASPQERREREKAELRTKILDAARELFVTEGYDAVTMRRVAEKIEYSPTAIYLHFADKDALVRELCYHDFEQFAGLFLEAAAITDPIARLRRSGEIYFAFALAHPQQYRFMFMTPRPPVEPAPGEAADPSQNAYAFLLAIVEQAIAERRLRPEHADAELVAQTIWGATHGVVALEIAKGCEKGWVTWRSSEQRCATMMDVLMAGLLRDAYDANRADAGRKVASVTRAGETPPAGTASHRHARAIAGAKSSRRR